MAKGLSLHVGVNKLGQRYFDAGWREPLKGCVNDAQSMYEIAKSQGFGAPPGFRQDKPIPNLLLDDEATIESVKNGIEAAKGSFADSSGEKGYFLLTFAGHGSYCKDTNGDEADGEDETWCLWDNELIDDELYGLLAEFRSGVRILVIADCCYSAPELGGPFFAALVKKTRVTARKLLAAVGLVGGERVLPTEVSKNLQKQDANYCMQVQKNYPSGKKVEMKAAVLYLAACKENETAEDAKDGSANGVFTAALKSVWKGGSLTNYKNFYEEIKKGVTNGQHPQLVPFGAAYPDPGAADPDFEHAVPPFTII